MKECKCNRCKPNFSSEIFRNLFDEIFKDVKIHLKEKGEGLVVSEPNAHYSKLGNYEPFFVFEAFVEGNAELFRDNPVLAGYYINVIKYLARINSKDTPLKNMVKAKAYIDKMIETLSC